MNQQEAYSLAHKAFPKFVEKLNKAAIEYISKHGGAFADIEPFERYPDYLYPKDTTIRCFLEAITETLLESGDLGIVKVEK